MEDIEIWKSVGIFRGIDYTDMYEVSTFGRIKSLDRVIIYKNGRRYNYKGKIITPHKNKYTGYMQVCICKNGTKIYSVHELVMNAHNPNPNPEIYTDINHIDEDKTNNRLDNLEWTTHKENCNHGTAIERSAINQRNNFIPIVQLDFKGNIINVYYNTEELDNSNFTKSLAMSSISKKVYIYNKYFWIKLDEYNELSFDELVSLITIKSSERDIRVKHKKSKAVVQLSINGEFIKEYSSFAEAAKEVGCSCEAVSQCVIGGLKTCKGYKWMCSKDFEQLQN